jgi:hypothetical protein
MDINNTKYINNKSGGNPGNQGLKNLVGNAMKSTNQPKGKNKKGNTPKAPQTNTPGPKTNTPGPKTNTPKGTPTTVKKSKQDIYVDEMEKQYKIDETNKLCYTRNDKCPICMQEYRKKNDWYQISECGHCICTSCADVLFFRNWINIDIKMLRRKCPICLSRIYWKKQIQIKDGYCVVRHINQLKQQFKEIKKRKIRSFIIEPLYRDNLIPGISGVPFVPVLKTIGRNRFKDIPHNEIFKFLAEKEKIDNISFSNKNIEEDQMFKVIKMKLLYNYSSMVSNIKDLNFIEELEIDSSKLVDLTNNISQLSTLKSFKISNADKLSILRSFSPYQSSPNKTSVRLEKLHIENCPNLFTKKNMQNTYNVINSYEELKHLILTKNKITLINELLFQKPNNKNAMPLKKLMLYQNELSDLPDNIENIRSTLEVLSISHNKFSVFPLHLQKLNKLKNLYVSGNSFDEIPEKLFDHIKVLHKGKTPLNLDLFNRQSSGPVIVNSEMAEITFDDDKKTESKNEKNLINLLKAVYNKQNLQPKNNFKLFLDLENKIKNCRSKFNQDPVQKQVFNEKLHTFIDDIYSTDSQDNNVSNKDLFETLRNVPNISDNNILQTLETFISNFETQVFDMCSTSNNKNTVTYNVEKDINKIKQYFNLTKNMNGNKNKINHVLQAFHWLLVDNDTPLDEAQKITITEQITEHYNNKVSNINMFFLEVCKQVFRLKGKNLTFENEINKHATQIITNQNVNHNHLIKYILIIIGNSTNKNQYDTQYKAFYNEITNT